MGSGESSAPCAPGCEAAGPLPDRELSPLPHSWRSLQRAFVGTARSLWPQIAMCDSSGVSLTYGQTLIRALALGRVLSRLWGPAARVGLMVPPTVPGAVANLAVSLWGKIPVNLNYSASQSLVDSSIDQCGITHVLTSAKVLDKFKITPKGKLDPAGRHPQASATGRQALGRRRRQAGADRAALGALCPDFEAISLDATATVIFTSGSTGDPKGVVLSHRNVLSNVHQIEEQVHLKPDEVLLGILPFFHSFGFTVTIWTALCLGKKVVYHFNPLDARTIGKLCEEHKVTLLDRHAVVHAILPEELRAPAVPDDHAPDPGRREAQARACRATSRRRLGIEPLEGYGCTELSPVVAVNVPATSIMPGRPHGPRQPPGDGRSAPARHGDQDDRSRDRGRPARRAPRG